MTAHLPSDASLAYSSPFASLDAQGLNLQAVFNVRDLPQDVLATLPLSDPQADKQLLLIGHLGPLMWQQLTLRGLAGDNPVDAFACEQLAAWFERERPGLAYRFVYPGSSPIGLQRLGELAGWHHPSPFMVGINDLWGSWFAYRAVVLADTQLVPPPKLNSALPCNACASRVCVRSCPVNALSDGYDLAACLAYRKQPDSACQDRCVARNSCPIGAGHRYSEDQTSYHYGRSLTAI